MVPGGDDQRRILAKHGDFTFPLFAGTWAMLTEAAAATMPVHDALGTKLTGAPHGPPLHIPHRVEP